MSGGGTATSLKTRAITVLGHLIALVGTTNENDDATIALLLQVSLNKLGSLL